MEIFTAMKVGRSNAGGRWGASLGALMIAVACGGGGGGGGPIGDNGTGGTTATGGSTSCDTGAEGCACYPNSTCDAGLLCQSNLCVPETGDTGGGPSTGGTNGATGGSGGASGGTGGTMTGTGGDDGTGGACTADTQTDPENCGACGWVCRRELQGTCDGLCCTEGVCSESFGACITHESGFTTCNAYCASIGEECVQGACGGNTYRAWGTPSACTQLGAPDGGSDGPCNESIDFGISNVDTIRCCCTDQAP